MTHDNLTTAYKPILSLSVSTSSDCIEMEHSFLWGGHSSSTKVIILFLCFVALHITLLQAERLISIMADPQMYGQEMVFSSDHSQTRVPRYAGKNSQIPVAQATNATRTVGYVRSEVIYGHIHVSKTAGTEISGELALHFERVCSHKGYSYDFHKVNKRNSWKKILVPDDVISQQYGAGLHRGRVPNKVMIEIGFEDCDFISNEKHHTFWDRFRNWPIEYHVPCREALSHLMSRCNFKNVTFNCNSTDLESEVAKCDDKMDRFSWNIATKKNRNWRFAKNGTNTTGLALGGIKCFNPIPVKPYINYMSTKLQRKRFEAKYVHRSTNTPRDKDRECLWKDHDLMDRVRKILVKNYDYYQFCEFCMGSENDLLKST